MRKRLACIIFLLVNVLAVIYAINQDGHYKDSFEISAYKIGADENASEYFALHVVDSIYDSFLNPADSIENQIVIDNKINLSKYKNSNEVYIFKKSGVFKIINNRRQTEAVEMASHFSLPIKFIKEREYINIIKKAFKDYDCKQQYFVPKEEKSGYYIDLYIRGHDKNIAIEVDENGHNSYDQEFEIERENYIKEFLGCEFIRFNPDSKDFNIGAVINKIMKLKNEPIKTTFSFTDDNVDTVNIIQEIIDDLDGLDSCNKDILLDLIDNFEIESIHNDINNDLRYEKDIGGNNAIIFVNDIPIMHTKDIVKIDFLNSNFKIISVDISHLDEISNKRIIVNYEFNKNIITVSLKGGFRKKQYIQNYFNHVKATIQKQKNLLIGF